MLSSNLEHTEITVKIDQSGWAWLVGGRKLFVWRYKGGQSTRVTVLPQFG